MAHLDLLQIMRIANQQELMFVFIQLHAMLTLVQYFKTLLHQI